MDTNNEGECSKHPCAPHGFNRNSSHSEDRYVCDCEGWSPDRSGAGLELLEALKLARAELAGLPHSLERLVSRPAGRKRKEEINMQPHQQRVVDEKTALDEKATALSNFIGTSPIFETLYPAEQERLKEQNDVMWQYSEILGARIAAFTTVV